jgi:galactonate dehydratase
MKIESIECFPLKIPNKAYVGGHDTRQKAGEYGNYITHGLYRAIYTADTQTLIVKMTTDTGLVGWGETQSSLIPQIVAQIVDECVAPGYIGKDPYQCQVLRDGVYDCFRDRGHDAGLIVDAISACDIACWDILGKAAGVPVYKLLGGSYHERVPCYVSGVPAVTVEEQIEKIRAWVDKGFRNFKISLGYGLDQDIAHITQLREALGKEIEILTDIHWFYNLNDAIRLGRAFEKLDVAFIECPMNAEVIERHTQLCAALDMPVALGEEFRTRYRFKERLEAAALDLAQPDIGRLGITECMRVIQLCNAYNIPVAPHIGSGLAPYTAASLHVAAATQMLFLLEFQPTQVDTADEYFSPSFQPTEGAYALPTVPGLGVEPDEEKLKGVAYA